MTAWPNLRRLALSAAICLSAFLAGCATMRPAACSRQAYPPNTSQRQAADFLLANLPTTDRLTISAAALRENINYAFKARSETAWAAAVPFDIFLHYVLPHRVINEPFRPWRKRFHDELLPLVRKSGSTLEAAIRVNLWCASRMEYRASSSWLLSPVDQLRVGFGRCEELTILFVTAARSVGIPIRGCWMPAWRHTDDNHVWAEIWDSGQWIPLEAASTVVAPGDNWFLGPARSAPAVYSPVYGRIDRPDAPVYRAGDGYTTLNLIGRYTEAASFEVMCLREDGLAAPGLKVVLWTLNGGSPSPVARGEADANGVARFILGKGNYIASTGDGRSAVAALTEAGHPAILRLGTPMPSIWTWTLTYPPSIPLPTRFPSLAPEIMARLRHEADEAPKTFRSRQEAAIKALDKQRQERPAPPEVLAAFKRCWPSGRRLLEEFKQLTANERLSVAPLVETLHPKDLAVISLMQLAKSEHDRKQAMARWPNQPPKILLPEVEAPRVALEPLTLSPDLARQAARFRRATPQQTMEAIVHKLFPEDAPPMPRTIFTAPCPPLLMGDQTATSRSDRLVLGVLLMRALGIPARLSALRETIMYWDASGEHPAPLISGTLQCAAASLAEKTKPDKLVRLSPNGNFANVEWPPDKLSLCFEQGVLLRVEVSRQAASAKGTFYLERF